MKLMPASRALATIRDDVASSVGPPNIMVPRQIGEIFRPLRPRLRYCIGWILFVSPSPRACGERVGVRGCLRERDAGDGPVPPHPDFSLRVKSDLSPQAGRGGKSQLSLFKILNTPLAIA